MEMSRETEMALLAAGAYWDIRKDDKYDPRKTNESNHAPIPEGWQLLPEHASNSGEDLSWSGAGFSARAYQRIGTNEVVISYATTEAGQTSHFFRSARKKQQLVLADDF